MSRAISNHMHVVLVEPEIPPNTGNIARLCAATRSTLHLIHPLGFKTDDKSLKRAGLDYWPHVEVIHHEDLDAFMERHGQKRLLLFSKKGEMPYTQAPYCNDCFLLFGKETAGLPDNLLRERRDSTFHIPMWGKTRSLNLSSAVAVVVYEGYKRLTGGFTWQSASS